MEVQDSLIRYNFDQNLNYKNIIENLQKRNILVLLENFPLYDCDLQSFISQIGKSINENRNNEGQDVFDVKIEKQNNFFQSIANSNLSFPLHTDCADFEIIPNCVGLLCVTPASLEQGINSFVFLDKIISQLPEIKIQELLTKKWKFRTKWRSVLTAENDNFKICYDRISIESFSEISKAESQELSELDMLFKQNAFNIKLKKGDLILFRNDLMLHGRSEIDINSNRLIKRIRFDVLD